MIEIWGALEVSGFFQIVRIWHDGLAVGLRGRDIYTGARVGYHRLVNNLRGIFCEGQEGPRPHLLDLDYN